MATLAAGSSSTSSSSGYDHLSDLGKTLSNTFPGLSPPINYVMVQNRGVGVEKIVTGHSWLTGNTGWDKNDLSTLQGCCETAWCWVISGNLALGVDVADISGNTCIFSQNRRRRIVSKRPCSSIYYNFLPCMNSTYLGRDGYRKERGL